jgi:Fe2+ or Zn2+ uptake regulation protein
MSEAAARLRRSGIRPSAQRVAVAEFVLRTDRHPSAEEVLRRVRRRFPMVSRATVYNTLNLFVRKGLLRQLMLAEGCAVFDAHVARHHHFIDVRTGAIHDVPWEAVEVSDLGRLEGFAVAEYQVVMRGRKRGGGTQARRGRGR